MVEREVIFLDTHVVVWMYQGKKIFSEDVRFLLSHCDLKISPIVRFELMMLYEKKRIDHPLIMLTSLKRDFYFDEEPVDFSRLVTAAMKQNFTRDPFDRMIVAHAKLQQRKLVTKDRVILAHTDNAIW